MCVGVYLIHHDTNTPIYQHDCEVLVYGRHNVTVLGLPIALRARTARELGCDRGRGELKGKELAAIPKINKHLVVFISRYIKTTIFTHLNLFRRKLHRT